MDVDIFIPCTIDQFYPEIGFNMVKILEKVGVVVHYNEQQTCCGQTAFNAGHWDEARSLGEKFIKGFSNERWVVAPSASCLHMVKNQYGKLFHNTSLHIEYNKLSEYAFELCDLLVNKLNIKHLGASFSHRAFLHINNLALHNYNLKEELISLLSNVKGLDLVFDEHKNKCCGYSSTFAVSHEPISVALAEQTVEAALDAKAEYIIVTEAGCLMQLNAYIKKHNIDMQVIHYSQVLTSGWDL